MVNNYSKENDEKMIWFERRVFLNGYTDQSQEMMSTDGKQTDNHLMSKRLEWGGHVCGGRTAY